MPKFLIIFKPNPAGKMPAEEEKPQAFWRKNILKSKNEFECTFINNLPFKAIIYALRINTYL